MSYKPTETKWKAVRMAIFAAWPGIPVFAVLMWFTSLSIWICLSIPILIVVVLDILVEGMRKQSEAGY